MIIDQSRNVRRLSIGAILVASGFAFFEIQNLFSTNQNWGILLTLPGLISLVVYVFLLLSGLVGLIFAFSLSAGFARFSAWIERFVFIRWVVVTGLVLSVVWLYLYSSWQTVWPGPWTQLIFAAGLALWISWLALPPRELRFNLREVALASILFAYPHAILDIRSLWAAPLVYRSATLSGCLLILILIVIFYTALEGKVSRGLLAMRARLGSWRWVLVILLAASPLFLRMLFGIVIYQFDAGFRFGILLIALWLLTCLIGTQPEHLVTGTDLVLGALILSVGFGINYYLLEVVGYPFSLTWSEGNRFYDYSLVFGQNVYQYGGKIADPYGTPGRYGLWGIAFLIQGLPIWAHRLWDALVRTLLPILLGWTLSRHIQQRVTRLIFFLWICVFFIIQAPVHPPFVLSFIIAMIFGFEPSLLVRAITLFVASYYAGLSRFTWVVAPAAWGILIDLLLYYPQRKGNFLRRLWPTLIMLAVGLLPGLIINLGVFSGLSTGQNPASNQPLLWYRLLPNPTYPLGVGPAMLLTTGPLLVLLTWWLLAKRWEADVLQKLAIFGGLTGFLVVGLIISTKIGGGGDLHNLDMYLAALTLVTALGIRILSSRGEFHPANWPLGIQAMLAILLVIPGTVFTPFTSYMQVSPSDDLLSSADVTGDLKSIQDQVLHAASRGEVLLMDQRQLLTFGYIRPIPFIPEYEKKYMMDKAMASDVNYFQAYYEDLARRRFTLILTEVLTSRHEISGSFSEENNAWVTWVSEPTLCFYEPLAVYKGVNIELLIPRQDPTGCEIYSKP